MHFLLLFIAIVTFTSSDCRKYDINAECIKMYGEDLKTVVKRFRGTQAYLKILKSKIDQLRQHTGDVLIQEYAWHADNKLEKRISEKFPPDEPTTCTPTKKGDDRRLYNIKRLRINNDVDNTINKDENAQTDPSKIQNDGTTNEDTQTTQRRNMHKPTLRRRDNEEGEKSDPSSSTISPVVIMDAYNIDANLTVEDINEARKIGFEVIGDIIHATIKDIASLDADAPSTKLPGGGGETTKQPTTTHVEKHTVGDESDEEQTAADTDVTSKKPKDETY